MGGCSGSWCVKPAIWYPAMRAAPYFARNSLYSGGNLAPSSRSALVISSSDDGPETLSSLTILLLTCNTIGAASCYRARARNLGSIDLRATVLHQGWRQGNESAWLLPQSRREANQSVQVRKVPKTSLSKCNKAREQKMRLLAHLSPRAVSGGL